MPEFFPELTPFVRWRDEAESSPTVGRLENAAPPRALEEARQALAEAAAARAMVALRIATERTTP